MYFPRIWANADQSKIAMKIVNITKNIHNLWYSWVKLWFKFNQKYTKQNLLFLFHVNAVHLLADQNRWFGELDALA